MSRRRPRATSDKQTSPTGLLVFGIAWTAFSLVFMVVSLAEPMAALLRLTWRRVPCTVDRFVIVDDRTIDKPFSPDVSFRFRWPETPQAEADGGAASGEMTGRRLRAGASHESDYATLAELREDVLARPTSFCWVDPEHPSQAVLLRGVPDWGGPIAGSCFSGCFVAVGVWLVVMSVRQRQLTGGDRADSEAPWVLYPFFGLFGLAGVGIFVGMVVPSWVRCLTTDSWVETPAQVIWSEVHATGSGRRTSWKADVFYSDTFGGKEHRSNTTSFFGDPSGRNAAIRTVAAHPPGARLVCFVNPRRPWQAVRNPSSGLRGGLLSLFLVPFMVFGCFGLRWVIRKRHAAALRSGQTGIPRPSARRPRPPGAWK